jgi:hypothetical protein
VAGRRDKPRRYFFQLNNVLPLPCRCHAAAMPMPCRCAAAALPLRCAAMRCLAWPRYYCRGVRYFCRGVRYYNRGLRYYYYFAAVCVTPVVTPSGLIVTHNAAMVTHSAVIVTHTAAIVTHSAVKVTYREFAQKYYRPSPFSRGRTG